MAADLLPWKTFVKYLSSAEMKVLTFAYYECQRRTQDPGSSPLAGQVDPPRWLSLAHRRTLPVRRKHLERASSLLVSRGRANRKDGRELPWVECRDVRCVHIVQAELD